MITPKCRLLSFVFAVICSSKSLLICILFVFLLNKVFSKLLFGENVTLEQAPHLKVEKFNNRRGIFSSNGNDLSLPFLLVSNK